MSASSSKSKHTTTNPDDITLRISELDVNIIPPIREKYKDTDHGGSKIILIGKPGSGKSTVIRSLLYEKRDMLPTGLVMSGTEDSNSYYENIFPPLFIYNSYNENVIEDFIKRQKMSKQHLTNPWAVLLVDDCADDVKIFRGRVQQSLFKNGRHFKMWYLLSMQYSLDVPPAIRSNVDGTFIFRESSIRNREILWKNYASCVDNFKDFCTIMDSITGDYTALYIHNATQSNKIEDCLFWYKAKPVPDGFKVGAFDYIEYSNQRYDTEFSYL